MPKRTVRLYAMIPETAPMLLLIRSPLFSTLLKSQEVEIEPHGWNGNPASLPKNTRAIVISTAVSVGSWDDIALTCAARGHFLLCNDHFVQCDGSLSDELEPAFRAWLGRKDA